MRRQSEMQGRLKNGTLRANVANEKIPNRGQTRRRL
jgi:hypothetical protein